MAAEFEFIISLILLMTTFFLYGLKWAILIAITIFFLKCTIDLYCDGKLDASSHFVEKSPKRSEQDNLSLSYLNEDILAPVYGESRVRRNIKRRNPAVSMDLQMSTIAFQRPEIYSALKSPLPLLAKVKRHLPFNNMSCYQAEKTARTMSVPNNSSSFNETLKWFTPPDDIILNKRPSLDQTMNSYERNSVQGNAQNTSTVKISRPGSDCGRFALESILHKRTERIQDNPCSRQSVMSALLDRKSRKRSMVDEPESILVDVAKKRRRDEFDDFFNSVNNPSLKPSYTCVLKKPSHEPQKMDATFPTPSSPTSESSTTSENSMDVKSSVSQAILNCPAEIVSTGKVKKRKSVTFRDINEYSDGPSAVKKIAIAKDSNASNGSTHSLQKDWSALFHTGFRPEKSITPEYLASLSSKRLEKQAVPRRLNITWKDIQKHRLDAWRRTQKLLDDIEDSLKDNRSSVSPVVTVLSSTPSLVTVSIQTTNQTQQSELPATQGQTMDPSTKLFTDEKDTSIKSASGSATGLPKITSISSLGLFTPPTELVPSLQSSLSSVTSCSSTSTFTLQPSTIVSHTSGSKISGGNSGFLASDHSSTQFTSTPKAGGFSFSPSTTSNLSVTPTTKASVVTNVTSSGFSLPTTSKSTTNANTFQFTGAASKLPSSGFNFAAPSLLSNTQIGFGNGVAVNPASDQLKSSGTVSFAAPSSNQPKSSGGFSFVPPSLSSSNQQKTSAGFTFSMPSTVTSASQISQASRDVTFTTPSTLSSGFQFSGLNSNTSTAASTFGLATTDSKTMNSSGFNFVNQNTPGTFNFGSSTPGGFNFTSGFSASTPIPSGRTSASLAKSRQRRRARR